MLRQFHVVFLLACLCLPAESQNQVSGGMQFQVNHQTTGEQGGADIATHSSGDFVVVWTSGSEPGRC